MSLIINNELIWVSIPKCGTVSLLKALSESNLNIVYYPVNKNNYKISPNFTVAHIKKSNLINFFGKKDTFIIKRKWLDKWISALQYFFDVSNILHGNETYIKFENIDNDFIKKNFNHDFANAIYSDNDYLMGIQYNKFFKKINNRLIGTLDVFKSTNYYTENESCSYEFQLDNIESFENFIFDRFKEKIKIERLNANIKKESKIQITNDLKNWIFEVFEDRFQQKNGKLI